MSKKREKNYLLILILIMMVSGSVLLYFFNINQGYWWDEAVYLGLARDLFEGKGYYINFNQETFRPPLFPVMIAGLWKIFGPLEIIRLLPPLFAILSVLVLYLFTKKLYGTEVALWASLILATSHMLLFYSVKILTESLFIFISLAFLYTFFIATEDKTKKYLFPVSGILMALAFLTRYTGLILPIVYILYSFLRMGIFKSLKNKYFLLGIALFFLVLTPWFWLNQINFNSPVQALFIQSETLTSKWYLGEWHYFFAHWIEIFGLVGLFAVPGVIALLLKIRRPNNILVLLLLTISLLFFVTIPRKEMRYMMNYLPIYVILFSFGVVEFRRWLNVKKIVAIVVLIFSVMNLIAGVQMILGDSQAGKSLKDAGLFIRDKIPTNTLVMTNNMPVIFYTSGSNIVYFPENPSELTNTIQNRNVSYIVIESREPSYPDYVWTMENWERKPSEIWGNFTLVKTFQENQKTYVWIYKV